MERAAGRQVGTVVNGGKRHPVVRYAVNHRGRAALEAELRSKRPGPHKGDLRFYFAGLIR